MEAAVSEPRAFDHFVLPVASLVAARARFSALGFTVAPDARHPFGTENCCVFLQDGTFIEPLAVGDSSAYAAALAAGNAFVGNDARFRSLPGRTGFSQLVVKSDDAKGDNEEFIDAGFSGGPILDFGRTFTKADGSTGEVAFRLAFAAPNSSAETGFFACEVIKSVPGGRGALAEHANGAMVTVGLMAVADDPMETDEFLSFFFESESEAGTELFHPAENGVLRVMPPEVYQMITGLDAPAGNGLRIAAQIIGVITLDTVRASLEKTGVAHFEKPGWIVVPPAEGQGAAIIFQGAQ
jgi:Glyoxalase-like domain